jgi:TolB-like protein/DNA-binding winged helix-turn-helix (wHTH) protein
MTTLALPGATRIVSFGTFDLDVDTGELRKRGIRIALQDQPFRVLLALLERPGDIVSREELCGRLWPGGTFVDFEHGLNAAVRRLRVALGDDADVPRFVETVHKRGYRFLVLQPSVRGRAADPRVSSGTLVTSVANRARLAVLPFGPYDAFTNGLTEEARTQLTQVCAGTIGVIAQTTVARAQREGTAAEICRALTADYLIEGHVRRDGDRVRITAQLIESQGESYLWAKTFDCVMTDVLSLQTAIAVEIARAVMSALLDARRASA